MVKKGMFIGERYEIIDKVGSGGMSDVYKAKDHKLGRFVAIKVLKQEFSEDKNFVSKFKIEAQSAAGLAHPNIVNIFDVGEDEGIYYIVMELIDGITLKTYINRKGQLPVKEAVSIAVQVAQGIEAAHNNHIIHRDIKPQNIMISREGKVKVTDFGIARAASTNTINSNAMGSVHYISPEQARNGYVDEKSDIYSLGISLYEMITGRVPFEGDSTVTIALQHVQDEIPPMRNFVQNIPVSVEKIVEKCTQKKPDRRYLKVSSLIADLKKSLVSPDEDFVQLIPIGNSSPMVMISENEVNVIKQDTGLDELINDIENDDDTDGIAVIPSRHTSDIDVRDEDIEYEDDYYEFDGQSRKFDKIVTIGSIVAAVVIVIAAIVIFSKFFNGCNGCNVGPGVTRPSGTTGQNQSSTEGTSSEVTTNEKQSVVPSVVGRLESDAISMIEENNLYYKVEYETNNNVDKGRVIEQSVSAGTVVDKYITITIVVSDGPEIIKVPDVLTMTKDEAVKILEDLGFVVKTEFELHDEIAAGMVIETKPVADKELPYGSEVKLVVSQGKDPKIIVPNVVGMTEELATQTLNELGLAINVVNRVYSDTVPAGQVIMQDIIADTQIDVSTTSNVISVTISLGVEETTTPVIESEVFFYYTNMTGDISSKLASLSLSDTEAATAFITAKLEYTNAAGEKQTDDVTSLLTGYDENDGVSYRTDWSQASDIEAKVYAESGTKVTLTITLSYLKDGVESMTEGTATESGTGTGTGTAEDTETSNSQTSVEHKTLYTGATRSS
ncbi:MAG: Stk1 family PASTA domain-containing Ser/Thr kinase [Lachnospiraceae bacterium]|nr:Stk1 family PASTA domain-containing Ser/Thr kinase [Lachnospiraceae bacterium]